MEHSCPFPLVTMSPPPTHADLFGWYRRSRRDEVVLLDLKISIEIRIRLEGARGLRRSMARLFSSYPKGNQADLRSNPYQLPLTSLRITSTVGSRDL